MANKNIVETLQSNIFDVVRQYMLSHRVYGAAEVTELTNKLGLGSLVDGSNRRALLSNGQEHIRTLTVLLNEGRLNLNYDRAMGYMLSVLRPNVYGEKSDKAFIEACRNAGIPVKDKFVPTAQSVAEKLQGSKSGWAFLGQGTTLSKSVKKEEKGVQSFFDVVLSAYYHQKVLGMAEHSFDVISKYQKSFLEENNDLANKIKAQGLIALGFSADSTAYSDIVKLITFADSEDAMLKNFSGAKIKDSSGKIIRDSGSKLELAGLYSSDAQEVTLAGYQIRSILISNILEDAIINGGKTSSISTRLAGLDKDTKEVIFDLISIKGETKKSFDENIKLYAKELTTVVDAGFLPKEMLPEFLSHCAEEGAFGFENKTDRLLAYIQASSKLEGVLTKEAAEQILAANGVKMPKMESAFDFRGKRVETLSNALSTAFTIEYETIKVKEKADLQQEVKNVLEPEKPEQVDSNARPAYESLPYYQRCLQQAREALKMYALAAQATQTAAPVEEAPVEETPVEETPTNPVDSPVEEPVSPVTTTSSVRKSNAGTVKVRQRTLKNGEIKTEVTNPDEQNEVTVDGSIVTIRRITGENNAEEQPPKLADGLTMGEGGQIELNLGGK